MQIAFILDIIIAVLLVLTITYAVRLNQRLGQLRGDKQELQELAKTFAEATAKAEAGIKNLKSSSNELRQQVKKAQSLRDELADLVDRGAQPSAQGPVSSRSAKPMTGGRDAAPNRGRRVSPPLEQSEEDRLIEEAIRAATPGHQPGQNVRTHAVSSPSGPVPLRSASGFSEDDLAPLPKDDEDLEFAYSRQSGGGMTGNVMGRLASSQGRAQAQPPKNQPQQAQQQDYQTQDYQQTRGARGTGPSAGGGLGGGLGGLSPQDRLLEDGPQNQGAMDTIGDSDAARELLKALSSVK